MPNPVFKPLVQYARILTDVIDSDTRIEALEVLRDYGWDVFRVRHGVHTEMKSKATFEK
jgi:hypothetical protein